MTAKRRDQLLQVHKQLKKMKQYKEKWMNSKVQTNLSKYETNLKCCKRTSKRKTPCNQSRSHLVPFLGAFLGTYRHMVVMQKQGIHQAGFWRLLISSTMSCGSPPEAFLLFVPMQTKKGLKGMQFSEDHPSGQLPSGSSQNCLILLDKHSEKKKKNLSHQKLMGLRCFLWTQLILVQHSQTCISVSVM